MDETPFHEWTSCEEYGHVYKTVWWFPEGGGLQVFKVCDDCGDEYETSVEEL